VAQTRIGFNNHRSFTRTYCCLSSTADYLSKVVQRRSSAASNGRDNRDC
jgi:hypothetical protein